MSFWCPSFRFVPAKGSYIRWCCIDGFSRFILGDAYGKMVLLSLDNLSDLGLLLIPLGEVSDSPPYCVLMLIQFLQVSPPTTLTYLTNQVIYVGSHLGDSQLVQLTSTPTTSTDKPTLPIPCDVHVIPSSSFDISAFKKGKARATSPEFDAMDLDGSDTVSPQESGNIVETRGSYLNVLERFKNIAPILDACLVDPDSGQVSMSKFIAEN